MANTETDEDQGLKTLFRSMPQIGKVEWIGVRPKSDDKMTVLNSVSVTADGGLEGDRFDGGRTGTRQVTLIQREHLETVAKLLGQDTIDPKLTRRQIVVSGINLKALKKTRFQIGSVVLEGTADCPPCSRMERNLGPGGYNAMRGHGGLCARVIEDGTISLEDEVKFLDLVETTKK